MPLAGWTIGRHEKAPWATPPLAARTPPPPGARGRRRVRMRERRERTGLGRRGARPRGGMRGGRKGGMYKGKGETERGAPRAAARHPVFHKLSKLFHRHKLQVPIATSLSRCTLNHWAGLHLQRRLVLGGRIEFVTDRRPRRARLCSARGKGEVKGGVGVEDRRNGEAWRAPLHASVSSSFRSTASCQNEGVSSTPKRSRSALTTASRA